jgi:ABC-type transporter Mla subunit MlaD
MASKSRNEVVAGIFVTLALAAGLGVLLWLGASEMLKKPGATFYFYSKHEQGNLGLAKGSAVMMGSNEVGKVRAVALDLPNKRTIYEISIDRPGIEVHQNAEAVIESADLLSANSIELRKLGDSPDLATRDKPVEIGLPAMTVFKGTMRGVGDTLTGEVRDTKGTLLWSLKTVAGTLVDVAKEALGIATTVNKEVDAAKPDSVMAQIHAAAGNVVNLSGDAAGMMKTVRPDVEKTIAQVRVYTEKDIAAILADLRTVNTKVVSIVGSLSAVADTARDVVVLNRDNLDDTLANLKTMSLNLSAAAKEIRRNPWRLLQKPDEKQTQQENIYDAARVFAEGAENLDTAVKKLTALRDARSDGIKADDPELARIRQNLMQTFEKFRTAEDALWKQLSTK